MNRPSQTESLRKKAAGLPQKPGIYFFKDCRDTVIYIGKARALRDRVKSYFASTADSKVDHILAETCDIDFILTGSEREAAFLENNFIRQHQPKFNLRLKDDKSFPYLKVSIDEEFPGIYLTRRVEPGRAPKDQRTPTLEELMVVPSRMRSTPPCCTVMP